jgi:hypothetical protein
MSDSNRDFQLPKKDSEPSLNDLEGQVLQTDGKETKEPVRPGQEEPSPHPAFALDPDQDIDADKLNSPPLFDEKGAPSCENAFKLGGENPLRRQESDCSRIPEEIEVELGKRPNPPEIATDQAAGLTRRRSALRNLTTSNRSRGFPKVSPSNRTRIFP